MASAKTYFARPVLVRGDKERTRPVVKHTHEMQAATKSSTTNSAVPLRTRKTAAELEAASPPPRPPPPRPERPFKHQSTMPANSRCSSSEIVSAHHLQTTPEPKPLTRTNVTKHDGIWQRECEEENRNGPSDILSPPLKYITPETVEDRVRNFNPLDVLDSASDHSDSSADTMIMMTTEEEKKNAEKINHSLKEFKHVKFKDDLPNTNKLKLNMQNANSVLKKYKDTNGRVPIKKVPIGTLNGDINHDEQEELSNKYTPLHIKTDHLNGSETISNKSNGHHGSPNDDSPDDGYGTNSSSGTVSSPFSSSFNSVLTEFDHSGNNGGKGTVLPNGAIKPNSVRENWAVKRKQRMIEAQDNSVQDQLRELTKIEEEGSSNMRNALERRENYKNVNILQPEDSSFKTRKGNSKFKCEMAISSRDRVDSGNYQSDFKTDRNAEPPFVNVSQNEIVHRNRQLYVRDSESDSSRACTLPARLNSRHLGLQTEPSNEINAPPPVPAHGRRHFSTPAADRLYDQVYEPATSIHRQTTGPVKHPGYNDDRVRAEDTRFLSIASQDSVDSAPLMLRNVADQQMRTPNGSGNIYVSTTGDEGCYSLNRSYSNASFQPITEVDESALVSDPPVPVTPQSPLEQISGDLLEKWSDMDRNYRNYYGFEEQFDKFTRTDSKINYFQEKKINTLYNEQDNYYQPQNYNHPSAANTKQESANQGSGKDSAPANQMPKASVPEGQKASHSGSKNKFFQILPNMFKPSSKKHNTDKNVKAKLKGKSLPVSVEPTSPVNQKDLSEEFESEAEYVNMSDLPQYSMANLIQEEAKKKGECLNPANLQRRPVFASSKDIQKLFSLHDQSFDSINAPGGQRHSFHAMPLSYRHVQREPGGSEDMRPRAQSTSATIRSQTMRTTVDNRMAVLHHKNATLSQRLQINSANSVGNLSAHSNSSNSMAPVSRTRLDSGSSGGDSKLSTLV